VDRVSRRSTMNAQSTDTAAINKLIADLQSGDDAVRGAAWQGAAPLGAPAVKPLTGMMAHQDFEIARAAKRALWRIVRYSARPKADKARKAVQMELVFLLQTTPVPVRREILWMLSEMGDSHAVGLIAIWLRDDAVREDARCSLERIPGSKATHALGDALKNAPEDFRSALANSLRARGRKIKGYPSQKLVPTKQTSVQAK